MNLPKVHSPTLRQALEEAAPTITGWPAMLERLDAESQHDIRAVEAWLLNSGIRQEAEVVYATWWEPAEMVQVRRALAWAPAGPTWRVLFREYRHPEGSPAEGATSISSSEAARPTESRPFVETPPVIRLQAGQALASLVKEIAAQLPQYT